MAPIVVDESVLTSWPIALSLIISLVVVLSLIVVLVMCCGGGGGGGGKKKEAEYVSFDFRSPYFCEICANRAWETFYPKDPNPMREPNWEETKQNLVPERADDYAYRLHYFNHESGDVFKEPTPNVTMRMKEECQTVMQHNRDAMSQVPRSAPRSAGRSGRGGGGGFGGSGGDRGFGGGGGGGSGEPTGFKSGRNPAIGTLYDAKSGVFDRGGGKKAPAASMAGPGGGGGAPGQTVMHGEDQMRAAQENHAYKTLFAAKSGVFDKPGGEGGGGGMGRPPQGSMAGGPPSPNETQMAAAAKNPAYKTLYDAKSGVFDKGGAKGVGMPPQSNYRP